MKADMHIHSNNFYRRLSRFKAMLHKYEDLGYTDLYFTDHFNSKMFKEGYTLDRFFEPVREARGLTSMNIHAGAEVKVSAGIEFLVYNVPINGFTKIVSATTLEQLRNNLPKDAIIVQAHPYRNKHGNPTLVHPRADGFEINTHPKHIKYSNNLLVHQYVNMVNTNYLITIGSDAHNMDAVGSCRLSSDLPLIESLITREFTIYY